MSKTLVFIVGMGVGAVVVTVLEIGVVLALDWMCSRDLMRD